MQNTCDVFGQREPTLYRRHGFTYREQRLTRVFVMASNHLYCIAIESIARYPRFRTSPLNY